MTKVKSKKPKRKLLSLAALSNVVASQLQKIVRLKASDRDGNCMCVTCGKVAHYKQMQGGHFIERTKLAVKLVTENVHPQCPYCNHYGMKKASIVLRYRQYMCRMYGERFVRELENSMDDDCKHSRAELNLLRQENRAIIRELEQKFEK